MENSVNNVRLGSYDGAWYSEYHGNIFVAVSQIIMEWSEYFVHQDNIWQTLGYIRGQFCWIWVNKHVTSCFLLYSRGRIKDRISLPLNAGEGTSWKFVVTAILFFDIVSFCRGVKLTPKRCTAGKHQLASSRTTHHASGTCLILNYIFKRMNFLPKIEAVPIRQFPQRHLWDSAC